MSETFNPFDSGTYATEGTVAQPETNEAQQSKNDVATSQSEETSQSQQTTTDIPNTESSLSKSESNSLTSSESFDENVSLFEWKDDFSKTIYDKLVNKDVSELADMLYEQKVLSSLDSMSDEDIIKLQMAYEYPDLSIDEIEEEFSSKYKVDDEIDEDMLTEDEISAKRKQIEKQQKAISREMKKTVREAKQSLQEMKKDIDFPDILSQIQGAKNAPISEDAISQYLAKQQNEQQEAYAQARKVYESSIQDGLNSFDGFSVNYKDEDVQFDGKYNLTQEDKTSLQESLKNFDLESFYGNRYFKDGKYDTKQLAEDVYFLQNRDKVVNAMVTQAVSKAKADLLKGMKNIDYSNQPRTSSAMNTNDYDAMVSKMFSI
jgi:hypothetical protein